MVNFKYRIEATVLTPLSIGQGSEKDWVKGLDYVVKDNFLYHLDLKKMVEAGVDMERVSSLFSLGRANEVYNLIGENRVKSVSDIVMKMPVSETANPIKTFLKNELTGRPILAGSSLKGSIRSALFNYLRDDERDNMAVFGNMRDGTDFMRFIRIGDMEFPKTQLYNSVIFNLLGDGEDWHGGWKHSLHETNSRFRSVGFNTVYECLSPDAASTGGALMMSRLLFDRITNNQPHYDKKKFILCAEAPNESLCDIINDYTYNYLLKEYDFFEKYQDAENVNVIMNNITKLTDCINDCEPNECVIKMSAGAGFHSITGDWQYTKDYYDEPDFYTSGINEGKRKYKSRKIVQYRNNENKDMLSLMGFIKLKISESK